MTTGTTTEVKQDVQLKKELGSIDFSKYLDYGNIRIQIRAGKMSLTVIERTYPD